MRNDLTPFRTVRELLQSNKCVLMGNAVNNEGELYDDSVENLTAILAMQDSYGEMLAALTDASAYIEKCSYIDRAKWLAVRATIETAISKAKGN